MSYEKRRDYQLKEWVNGRPYHNHVDQECCPDFSCCRRILISPYRVRVAFARANDEERLEFLGVFLGKMVDHHFNDRRVYVAGLEPQKGESH